LQNTNRSYLYANVTHKPGVWNELWVSTSFSVLYWIIFSGNLSLLLYGVYRLASTLILKRSRILTSIRYRQASVVMARESCLILTGNAIVFLTLSLLGLVEHLHDAFHATLSIFYWMLMYWTISLFHISWCKVACRVFQKDRRYKYLSWLTMLDTVVATISGIMLIVAWDSPTWYSTLYWPARLMFYIVGPTLYIIQSVCFVVLGTQFMSAVAKVRMVGFATERLQRMTRMGMALLVGTLVGYVGAVFLFFDLSLALYCVYILLMSLAGWIAQFAAFIMSAKFDEHDLQPQTILPTQSTTKTRTNLLSAGMDVTTSRFDISRGSTLLSTLDASNANESIEAPKDVLVIDPLTPHTSKAVWTIA